MSEPVHHQYGGQVPCDFCGTPVSVTVQEINGPDSTIHDLVFCSERCEELYEAGKEVR